MYQAIRPIYSKDITRSGERQRFLWHQYSERCAAIAAVNFSSHYGISVGMVLASGVVTFLGCVFLK
jgi:hypothetical protein